MLKVKITKNRYVCRVLRDSSKEVAALVNKTVRRGSERRLLRNELEVLIGQHVDSSLSAVANSHINVSVFDYVRPRQPELNLEPALARRYDGNILTEETSAYLEEKELVLATIDKLIAEEAKKFIDDVDMVMSDTKTLCGNLVPSWGTKNDIFSLYTSSDLILAKEDEPSDKSLVGPGKSKVVRKCTCGEFNVLRKDHESYRLDRSLPRPTNEILYGAFWFCKEEGRFFNVADITNEANANKVIEAYVVIGNMFPI